MKNRFTFSILFFIVSVCVMPYSSAYGAAWGGWGIPNRLQINSNSLGTASTDGLILSNSTAAAAAAQQISPRLRLTGQGWKTNAPAASQAVDWIAELVPVQGADAPQAKLNFKYQVNNGGFTSTLFLLNNQVGIGTTPNAGEIFSVQGLGGTSDVVFRDTRLLFTPATNLADTSTGNYGLSIKIANDIRIFTNAVDRLTADNVGNILLNASSVGTNATKILAFGGPATAPTTSPANVFQLYPTNVAGAGTMGLAWRSEDAGVGILGSLNGFGTTAPAAKVHIGGDNARPLSIDKSTVAVVAPGAGIGMLRWEVGTNAGTLKLVGYSGTSVTGITIVDNVGTGN